MSTVKTDGAAPAEGLQRVVTLKTPQMPPLLECVSSAREQVEAARSDGTEWQQLDHLKPEGALSALLLAAQRNLDTPRAQTECCHCAARKLGYNKSEWNSGIKNRMKQNGRAPVVGLRTSLPKWAQAGECCNMFSTYSYI